MTAQSTIEEYLKVLSSKAPVPGGGGASALAGALGNALGQMVANLTIGKKKYADAEEEIIILNEQMQALQAEFIRLADQDAEVFAPLAASYSLPSTTEEERQYKETVMEENLLSASLVPIQIMEKALSMLTILEVLAKKGSRMAVSDVGVAVQFVRASLLGAVMNVYINTKSMKNREKADEINCYADQMIADGTGQADEIYGLVLNALKGVL